MDIKSSTNLGKIKWANPEQQDGAEGDGFLKILNKNAGAQSSEGPFSEERGKGRGLLMGLKNLVTRKTLEKPSGQDSEKAIKMSLQWRDGEISKTEGLPEGEGKHTEFHKIIKAEDRSSKTGERESNNVINLQDVLGIKHNEFSGGGNSGDTVDVFQLGDIRGMDSKDVVKKITDYLIQNGIKNLDSLEVLVDHEDLGKFKIDARRVNTKGLIDLKIEAETLEGKDFFQKNEALLNRQLSNAGINLQDLKIVESKENVLLNSFFFKQENNQFANLENDVRDENHHSNQEGGEKNKKRYYANDKEHMNNEEDDA